MKNILRRIAALSSAFLCLSWAGAQRAFSEVRIGESIAQTRLVTPNGDNKNDTFIFKFYNPRQLTVTGRIFNIKGVQIASMKLLTPLMTDSFYSLEWDPNSGGRAPGGVYLYQIIAEGKVYKGAVAVIR